MEAEPLKLTAKHFPFSCSLQEPVRQRFTDASRTASGTQALTLEEILAYLASWDELTLTPMQSILQQTEALGDPALPTADQVAVLHWLGAAFDEWERTYPLETPLATELRRLKPLTARVALTNPTFLIPGQHPLHQLLDNLQLAAVGWQARLGRAGQACHRQVMAAVSEALALDEMEPPEQALAELNERVHAATRRDLARADRMAQRMIEAEHGRIKTARAKWQAAAMINAALEKYQTPKPVGSFLKGPWYESAQLLLLKFGADSEQWRQMTATTDTLLDSAQVIDADDEVGRQRLFDLVTRLPRQLKRWLLSLQHDSDAVDEAIGVIEFTHLKILRKQPLELECIEPLPLDRPAGTDKERELPAAVQAGQWYRLDMGQGKELRARLVLRLDDEQQLLFANQAGIKVLRPGFAEFAALLEEDRVSPLPCGASFSIALAAAAGIRTTDKLDELLGPAAASARREAEAQEREQAQRLEQARRAEVAAQREGKSQRRAETLRRELVEQGLAMGCWLGFYDQEQPLMARLALYDRDQHHYIFVNRKGKKARQLGTEELLSLVDGGLVDMLEAGSRFRAQIRQLTDQPSADTPRPEEG